jgi:hypothetical protein
VDSLQHKRLYVHIGSHYHPVATSKNHGRYLLLENCIRNYLREKLDYSPKVVTSKVTKEYIRKVVMSEEEVCLGNMLQEEALIEFLGNLPLVCDNEAVQYVMKKVIVEQSKSGVLEVKTHYFYSFV